MENGHEDRVRLWQDGFRPGRQMGLSVMLCYSIYMCVCVGEGGSHLISELHSHLTELSLTLMSAKAQNRRTHGAQQ